MKSWEQVERRIERNKLPYRVERFNLSLRGVLVTLDGQAVAYTVQGARDRFASPGHPDSKRQTRCKQRSLTRYGARILKQSGVTSCPPIRCNRRREFRDMQRRLAEDRKAVAELVAHRLMGNVDTVRFLERLEKTRGEHAAR